MKVDAVKGIAKQHKIKMGKANKSEIIRAIQQAEGNQPCYNTNSAATCGQFACMWREDCV